MSLFAIADTHLSLSTGKTMEVFRGWVDYEKRLEKQWKALVEPEDTVVVAGDICWAMRLEEALPDFRFLEALPGRKILLKGNHDYWWTTLSKMNRFLEENNLTSLCFLYNNAYRVGDTALCGTRGWFYDAETDADKKVLQREVGRLRASIQAAKTLGGEPIAFLHYPPLSANQVCEELFAVLREEGIRRCCYGHVHAKTAYEALRGRFQGIEFRLISSDFLEFCPILVEKS